LVKPPERNYAIRVSGGEIEAPPPPSPAASHSAAATVHTLPEAAEAPVTQPAVVPTIPELEAATSGEGAVKPQKPSNRLVRAIGKINPFHKGSKDDPADPAKPPAKKD
jgi:hypothetical protein